MITAIYTRQSVEKKDSLSLQSQSIACVALCDANNWTHKEYTDSGFSGKSVQRPAMQQLLADIKCSKIERVIVYKMDRISRSVLDFSELLKLFDDNDISFISATEQFDTSTPMGRAMVYITMTFAQMERETIRERVRDNWYYRAKQGIFTGGKPPYGYVSVRSIIDKKTQSILSIDTTASKIVNSIFDMFTLDGFGLRALATELNAKNITPARSDRWTHASVRTILRNSIYAPATPVIYKYHNNLGILIINELSEFSGEYGVYVGGTRRGSGKELKFNKQSDRFLIIGRHRPLISDVVWLATQKKLDNNINTRRLGTSKVSWLGGLVFCGECGYRMYTCKNSSGTHYIKCGGRNMRGLDSCPNAKSHKIKVIEDYVFAQLSKKVTTIDISVPVPEPNVNIDIEIKIAEIESKIANLITAIENGTPCAPLNIRIEELEKERLRLVNSIVTISADTSALLAARDSFVDNWSSCDIFAKHRIVKSLINKIIFYADNVIEINYNL